MRFVPNQTVLDGENRYEADQEYDVPEARARYMVSFGWGDAPDLDPQPEINPPPARVTLRPNVRPDPA